jgi:hypothetical protein
MREREPQFKWPGLVGSIGRVTREEPRRPHAPRQHNGLTHERGRVRRAPVPEPTPDAGGGESKLTHWLGVIAGFALMVPMWFIAGDGESHRLGTLAAVGIGGFAVCATVIGWFKRE